MASISGNIVFDNTSVSCTTETGQINGVACFCCLSVNYGVVCCANFTDSSNNVGVTHSSNFCCGSVNNGTIVESAKFYGETNNFGSSLGNTSFFDYALNQTFAFVNNANFYDASANIGSITGNANFSNASHNQGIIYGDANFIGASYNAGGIISGNAIFGDGTENNGTVCGNAFFATGASQGAGTVIGATGVLEWYSDNSFEFKNIVNNSVIQVDAGNGVKYAEFDGSTSYLETDVTVDFAGDFTIEMFVRLYDDVGLRGFLGNVANFNANTDNFFLAHGLGAILAGSVTNYADEFGTLDFDRWYHIAITRKNSTIKMWIDGSLSSYTNNTISTFTDQAPIYIGVFGPIIYEPPYVSPFKGRITNLRIIDGISIYNDTFEIPTSVLTSTPETKLLLNFGATAVPDIYWYKDTSSQNHKVKLNGIVTKSNEGNGVMAAEFNGNGNFFIDLFNFNLSENSTIEFWMKTSSFSTSTILGSTGQLHIGVGWNGERNINVYNYNTVADQAIYELDLNEWLHIAIVSLPGSSSPYKKNLYINGILRSTNNQTFENLTSLLIGSMLGNYVGKLAGLRMVAGTAIYTENFTVPTTLPTAVSGTKLLLNFGATTAPSISTKAYYYAPDDYSIDSWHKVCNWFSNPTLTSNVISLPTHEVYLCSVPWMIHPLTDEGTINQTVINAQEFPVSIYCFSGFDKSIVCAQCVGFYHSIII
jgi:hypothetical protein